MDQSYSFIDDYLVIAYLLRKAADEGRGLTPLQINKLVYISHGWALGKLNRPLIDNRYGQIEAWKYGPVVRSVYDRLKGWKGEEITFTSYCEDFGSFGMGKKRAKEFLLEEITDFEQRDPLMVKLLDIVWHVYKELTGGQLITITHKEETPWKKHVKFVIFNRVVHGVHIPDSTIAEHYRFKLMNTPPLTDV